MSDAPSAGETSADFMRYRVRVEGTTVFLDTNLRDWRFGLSIQTAAPFEVKAVHGLGPQPDFWSMESSGRRRCSFADREIIGAAAEACQAKRRAGVWRKDQANGFLVGLMMFGHRALATCARTPGLLVERLHPRLRFCAYQLLCADGTQRLAQLRVASPGAFVLLAALSCRRRTATHGEALRRDVVSGRKLNHALRDVLAAINPAVDAMQMQTWLALIRRAPPTVHSMVVNVAPPRGTSIDDLPVHPATRRCWLDIVSWLGWVLSLAPPHPVHPSLAEFISRHGNVVGAWLHRKQRDLRDLVSFVEQTGRSLGRSVAPLPVLRDFARYQQPLNPFPAAPLPSLLSDEARLKQVPDRLALHKEALALRNCARQYTRQVEVGLSAFYVGVIRGRRMMVQLTEAPSGWRLEEMRGSANRMPTEAEIAIVEQWVSSSQPRSRG